MAVVSLLTTAFTLLRSARHAIAVADIGGSASFLPYYELIALPATLALSWFLAFLLRKYPLSRVFYYVLAGFILFFLSFALFCYPFWHVHAESWQNSPAYLEQGYFYLPVTAFFIAAELWKIALISILFWGFINNYMSIDIAKTCYAPLMLGTSIGGILASPLINISSNIGPHWLTEITVNTWHATLLFETGIVAILGIIAGGLFYLLARRISTHEAKGFESHKINLYQALNTTLKTPLLYALSIIILTDYLCYTLFEVVFLNTLKTHYPDPVSFNAILGSLHQWGGLLTALSALIIGPWIMRSFSWKCLALITPLSVFAFACPYLLLEVFEQGNLNLTLIFGCTCYCMGRATKYALLDSSKELAYLTISRTERLQGKLIIEGLVSRGGRGLASLVTIGLVGISGGILPAMPALFLTFTSSVLWWTKATILAGDEVKNENLSVMTPSL